MITAVDTSVLLDVFAADARHVVSSQEALRHCLRDGALVLCDVVLAELRPRFDSDASLNEALSALQVRYTPTPREAALLAGEAWQHYRSAGGARERMVPDFLVAGHAVFTADRLLTRDRGFSRRWFSALTVLEPGG